METSEGPSGSLATYFVVYACILVLAALQMVIAYEHIDGSQIFLRMLLIAIVQAGLAVMFFMHMKSERRNLALFLVQVTVFVLAVLNMFWADILRLLTMRPFAH